MGDRTKEKLCCSCGVVAQHDLYSAYLACYVEKDVLMADQARVAWSGMDIALRCFLYRTIGKRSVKHYGMTP